MKTGNNHKAHKSPGHLMFTMAFGLMLLLETLPAFAGGKNLNPGILPPQSNPFGHSYSEWGGAFWRWLWSIPVATHPWTDNTGQFAGVNQSGPVWFLAGNYLDSGTLDVTIPAGKGIFIPVTTFNWVNLPDYGDNPWSPEQNNFVRSLLAQNVDGSHDLACTIDGYAIQGLGSYRAQTAYGSEYLVNVPDNNITGFLPAGTYGPSLDDGIYLMLAPLSVGKHVIHIVGTYPDPVAGEVFQDTTYKITVK